MKKWVKQLFSISPEDFALRSLQYLESKSGLRALIERPHDYRVKFEQVQKEEFSKRASFICGESSFEINSLQEYFALQPGFKKDLAIAEAEFVLVGAIRLFDKEFQCGDFPNWHRDPFDNFEWPRQHYSRLRSQGLGDFRTIWELGRLAWLTPLLRAHLLDQDSQWRLHYFSVLRSFVRDNPVGEGVHWVNAQEVAIRGTQILIALRVFGDSISDEEFLLAANVLYWHAKFVNTHFEFADVSLGNNHALIEAGFLGVIGNSFPSWEESEAWMEISLCALERHRNQFYEDGGYIQHSHNYHRLALMALMYFEVLGLAIKGYEEIFKRSVFYFESLLYAESGFLPNFGNNDSAFFGILPSGAWRNFRPFLSALMFRANGVRFSNTPQDNELGCLLFGKEFLEAPVFIRSERSHHFPISGLAILKTEKSAVYVRTGLATMKSGHDDFAHVDIWIEGKNVAIDSGSFLYFSENGERDPFSSFAHHNVLAAEARRIALGNFSWLDRDIGEKKVTLKKQECELSFKNYIKNDWAFRRILRTQVSQDQVSQDQVSQAQVYQNQAEQNKKGGVIVIDQCDPLRDVEVSEFTISWLLAQEKGSDFAIDDSQINRSKKGISLSISETYDLEIIAYGAEIDAHLIPTFHSPNYRDKIPAVLLLLKISSDSGFRIQSHFRIKEVSK